MSAKRQKNQMALAFTPARRVPDLERGARERRAGDGPRRVETSPGQSLTFALPGAFFDSLGLPRLARATA